MPRRSLFTADERESLLAIPTSKEELIRYYTLSEADLSLINQHRGPANRLGFAVQLSVMRYPGIVFGTNEQVQPDFINFIAKQINVSTDCWNEYGQRGETRREHLLESQSILGLTQFTMKHYRLTVHCLDSIFNRCN